MTSAVGEKQQMAENKTKPNKILPQEYGCEINLEKTSVEKAKDSTFPNDAYLIWYVEDGEEHIDLTRGYKRVNLFDMYYDKYGPGSIKKIDFGYGRVNPRLWGYQKSEKKKRK